MKANNQQPLEMEDNKRRGGIFDYCFLCLDVTQTIEETKGYDDWVTECNLGSVTLLSHNTLK